MILSVVKEDTTTQVPSASTKKRETVAHKQIVCGRQGRHFIRSVRALGGGRPPPPNIYIILLLYSLTPVQVRVQVHRPRALASPARRRGRNKYPMRRRRRQAAAAAQLLRLMLLQSCLAPTGWAAKQLRTGRLVCIILYGTTEWSPRVGRRCF